MKKHLMIAALATLIVPSVFAAPQKGLFGRTKDGVYNTTIKGNKKFYTGTALAAVALALVARKQIKGFANNTYNKVTKR